MAKSHLQKKLDVAGERIAGGCAIGLVLTLLLGMIVQGSEDGDGTVACAAFMILGGIVAVFVYQFSQRQRLQDADRRIDELISSIEEMEVSTLMKTGDRRSVLMYDRKKKLLGLIATKDDNSSGRREYHDPKFFEPTDILEVEARVGGNIVAKTDTASSVGRGIAGAAVGGLAGAVVGVNSAAEETSEAGQRLELRIVFRDDSMPSHTATLLNPHQAKNLSHKEIQQNREYLDEWYGRIRNMIDGGSDTDETDRTPDRTTSHPNQVSNIDRLERASALKENGHINEEEFDRLKAEILDNNERAHDSSSNSQLSARTQMGVEDLGDEDICEIRTSFEQGDSLDELASEFCISVTEIVDIARGEMKPNAPGVTLDLPETPFECVLCDQQYTDPRVSVPTDHGPVCENCANGGIG